MIRKVVIIDYDVGNTLSVYNAVHCLGYQVRISHKNSDIADADAIILPGVGAFDEAMSNFNSRGLQEKLTKEVLEKGKPTLGICVGMQILAEYSEENGRHEGLNWIPGRVEKLELPGKYSVPHVGWNDVKVNKKTPLFTRLKSMKSYYFDHSYHFICDPKYVSAYCDYSIKIIAGVQNDFICGVQFHPEKSQLSGLRLIKGFLANKWQ